jgi:hypothetical protein
MEKRGRALVALFLAALLFAACTTYDVHDTAPLVSAVLTGSDPFNMVSSPGQASFVSRVSDNNTREAFWPSDSPAVSDSETCAIWATETSSNVQQGAALRIRQVSGGYRLITVTKNTWLGAYWIFNFHVWDTSKNPPFILLGGIDLSGEFLQSGTTAWPPPWYLCARAYGSTLEFKAWRAGQAEPAYGDPHYGGAKSLPAGWNDPGATGWYIGHAPTNTEATFTDLVTRTP